MNGKKRNRSIAVLGIIIAAVVGIAVILIPWDTDGPSRNNIRHDEVSNGELYNRVPLDYSETLNDIIVVKIEDSEKTVSVGCYKVVQGFDVLNLLSNVGVDYGPVAQSVHGIVYEEGRSIDDSPVYRFLFQASLGSRDAWYMTRVVEPIYVYENSAGIDVEVTNEGFTVDDVLIQIDAFLTNQN